ncbi:Protein kinase domain [Dillenia turbinata]|uniref:Protein kinase domain n=1 Tax=Dillenia turbinata TaxID=194707 RepID=A0AAN8VST0_9MAGN
MMILPQQIFTISSLILIFHTWVVLASTYSNSVCSSKSVPYPFGFSDGFNIKLNCSKTGEIKIGDFVVQSISPNSITVSIEPKCNRPINAVGSLFGHNYAPTSRNGILLQNCSQVLTCNIPTTAIQTRFELQNCSRQANDSLSCYSETDPSREFMDYKNLSESNCGSLFSGISAQMSNNGSSLGSLEVQVVQLGYWLEGQCKCSKNANCTPVVSPVNGKKGFRCQCSDGYSGDGYADGEGCQKAGSSNCKLFSNYLSRGCGGLIKLAVLMGGSVIGVSLMTSSCLLCCFIRRRRKQRTLKTWKISESRLNEATGHLSIPIYTYKDIEKATNDFSDKQRLGTGAWGIVYSAKLQNDKWVAIKRMKCRGNESLEQVMNEIKLISSVNHPNLVRLLGCSIEIGEQILVYEFMPNGTLSQHLHRERGGGLEWAVRLSIAKETAQAIAYLHSAINPPIYHRDIKSSNILLDNNLKSKVADFGLSRLGMVGSSYISTAPQGTPGYLDPQYHQNYQLSDKSDVYSFGVVLVEIITALEAVDFSRPQDEVNLAALAADRIAKGCLDEIMDPFIKTQNDDWITASVHKVAELAFRCLAFHRDMRPTMMEVAAELEQIGLSRWASSEENFGLVSSEESSCCSSSSNGSVGSMSMKMKDRSSVSVQNPCLSVRSSFSSNSVMGHAVR